MTETQGNRGFSVANDSYPRVHECLAPSRLSKFLSGPVPEWLAAKSSDYLYLCDLDASIWNYVPFAEVYVLAEVIVESIRTQADSILHDVGNEPLLRAAPDTIEVPLRLSPETVGMLTALGSTVARFDRTRVRDLLTDGGNGARALVDVLASLEYWGFGRDELWKRRVYLSATARKAEVLLSKADVASSDPRLGAAIESLRGTLPYHVRSLSMAQASVWLADHAHAIEITDKLSQALRDVVNLMESIKAETLSEQIDQAVMATAKLDRDARILLRRHGLDGRPPATLQEVADEEGLTRERIRQICVRMERQLSKTSGSPYAPALDEAIAVMEQAAPFTTQAALEVMRAQIPGLDITSVEATLEAARLLHRNTSLELRDGGPISWVCHADDEIADNRAAAAIRTRAGRLCDSSGATTLEALREALSVRDGLEIPPDELVALLPHLPGFEWLDRDLGWFWVTGRNVGRSRFFNLLRKALSVAGRLSLDEVRNALRRSRRLVGPFPPASVLRKMCERRPGFHLEGDNVHPDSELAYREVLQGTELYVVELLMQLGNVARVEDMWQIAGSEGVGRMSFWVTLQNSPAIMKYARSTYGLRGVPAPATEIWEVANRRIKRANSVLQDWGRHSDSAYWMMFRLSGRAAQSGQVSVPGDLSAEISGEYSVYFQQRQTPGAVTIRDTSMWGLRRLFRFAEVEQGDWALFVVDPKTRSVHAQIGDEELSLSDDADIAELLAAGFEIELTEATVTSESDRPSLFDDLSEADETEECDEVLDADFALVREVLARAYRPLKAREIASAIGLMYGEALDRREVNHILYGALKAEVQGHDGLWVLLDGRVKLSEEG